jgi:hypothetical protein
MRAPVEQAFWPWIWPPVIQCAPGLDSLTCVDVGILLTVEIVTDSGLCL